MDVGLDLTGLERLLHRIPIRDAHPIDVIDVARIGRLQWDGDAGVRQELVVKGRVAAPSLGPSVQVTELDPQYGTLDTL